MIKFDCETCGKVDKAILDGYHFGDRLLDGVKFECTQNDDGTFEVVVSEESKEYFKDLNTKKWLQEAKKYAKHRDIFECPTCHNDVVPDNLM